MSNSSFILMVLAGGILWFLTALLVGTVVGRLCLRQGRDEKGGLSHEMPG